MSSTSSSFGPRKAGSPEHDEDETAAEQAARDRIRKLAHDSMFRRIVSVASDIDIPVSDEWFRPTYNQLFAKPGHLRLQYGAKSAPLDVEMTPAKSQFVMALVSRLVEGGWTEALEEPSADPDKLAEMALAALPSRSPWDKDLGPFFDTPSLAKWKGVSRQRLATLRKENRLIGLRAADTAGTILYPRFQFEGRGRLLPRLPEIWPVLTSGYPEWTAATWLNTPDPDWQDRTAADVLRYGSEDDVSLVLREAAQQAAGVAAR